MGLNAFIALFKKKKPHKTCEGKIALTLAAHDINVVIDVGANIGQTYENLRRGGFRGTVISVEPLPSLQTLLQTKSNADPYWHVLKPLALGDHDGECEIHVSQSSDMSSVLKATPDLLQTLPKTKIDHDETVPMKTLDTLYGELEEQYKLAGKNVFIKMDTQGSEMMILQNAKKTLKKIIGLQVEMSLFELYEGEVLYDEIIAFLKKNKFNAHMMIETNFSRKLNRQLQVDGVFYKDQK